MSDTSTDTRTGTCGVTVVMATYQGARFVREQIESLLAQTEPPAELIVADDGSTDGTLEVVERALVGSSIQVRIVRSAERKGYRRNFIEAAALATSPLVAFCDQDDVWHPDKLARMRRVFDDPGVMLSYHNAVLTDQEGSRTGVLYGSAGARVRSESLRADPWSFSLGFTQMFRAELLRFGAEHPQSRDFLFPREVLAHDQWFVFLASSFGRVQFVDEHLASYRQHDANLFSAVDRSRARRMAVLRATLDQSHGQLAARERSLSAGAGILRRIAADIDVAADRRAASALAAVHLDDLAHHYRRRTAAYRGHVIRRASAWVGLIAARRRLESSGISYPARHAVRDGLFGVALAKLAAAPKDVTAQ
jgi:glycosyltransferase involved in cell wall biosynthesis